MTSFRVVTSKPELPVLPLLRKLLAAEEVCQCHAALEAAVRQLEEICSGPALAICEIALSPLGLPSIVWRGTMPESMERNFAAAILFEEWFSRARKHQGRLCAYDGFTFGMAASGEHNEIASYVGLLAHAEEPSPALESAMRDICLFGAQHLGRLRRQEETRRSRERLDEQTTLNAELLRASADLLWEAGEDGIITVTHVFNGRRDIARLFQGRSLREITIANGKSVHALAQRGKNVRQARVNVGEGERDASNEKSLYLTLCAPPGPGGPGRRCHGAVSAGPDTSMDQLAIDAQVLENMMGARVREDEMRREAETLLLGLRTLLANEPFHEKLQRLALHLADAVRGVDVRLFEVRPGEAPHLLLPPGEIAPENRRVIERILTLGGDRPVSAVAGSSDEGLFLQRVLDMRAGEIAVVMLALNTQRFYLLCSARQPAGFSARDRGFMERFSLLLQQAILLRDDQTRTVHAAKLSALGQMSASIAHELRQPLNTISIAAQNIEGLVEKGDVPADVLRQKTERILRQVERACKVMDRMRRFSRKSSGEYKPVSVVAMVRGARALMDQVLDPAGIAVDIAIPEDLQVLADELEIEQVLVNLLQNAADAIRERNRPGAAGRIRISSGAADANGTLRLHVQDNGPGFAPDVQKHALDAFFTTKPKAEGTGLGLSISHAILREHGGRLEIGNWEGGGMVTLYLRQAKPASGAIIQMHRLFT